MEKNFNRLFEENDQQLEKINQGRRRWLYASSVVFTGIIILIFIWDWLDHFKDQGVWWFVISLMLILSINWWYWTMNVVYKMLVHQKHEFRILKELIHDIKEVKNDIRNLVKPVDNRK